MCNKTMHNTALCNIICEYNDVIMCICLYIKQRCAHCNAHTAMHNAWKRRCLMYLLICRIYSDHSPKSFLTRLSTESFSGSYGWSLDGISRMAGNGST